MSGVISYGREILLKDLQEAGVAPVHTVMPPVIHPPALIVSESSPLLQASETIGGITLTFTVLAVVEATPADREKELASLDHLLDDLVSHLWKDYRLTIEGYRPISLGAGQNYLSTQISIPIDLNIKE